MLLISNANFERLCEEYELRVVNLGNQMKLFLILAKITYARDRKDVKDNISGCNLADLKTELDERQSTLPRNYCVFFWNVRSYAVFPIPANFYLKLSWATRKLPSPSLRHSSWIIQLNDFKISKQRQTDKVFAIQDSSTAWRNQN